MDMCKRPIETTNGVHKCGQCKECLIQRSKDWALRLDQEAQSSTSAYFITCTYRESDITYIDTCINNVTGEMATVTTLVKMDMQLFIKRLRKQQAKVSEDKLRVFYTGEYGGKTRRAHYHAIIFNLDKSLTSFNQEIQSKKAQKDPKLAKIWKLGFVKTGRVEGSSIRYVTNYMLTKNIDTIGEQEKPFMEMSRGKGIGYQYVEKNQRVHFDEGHYQMALARPEKYRPNLQRYYQEKVFDEDQRKVITEFKIEDYNKHIKVLHEQAEKERPEDPLGWIEEMREVKRTKRKSPNKKAKL